MRQGAVEVLVQQAHQERGLDAFGDGGESGDVGEQEGGVAPLAADAQGIGVVHELLHHRRRQVVAEGSADPAALRLGPGEVDERARHVDEQRHQRRQHRVDQQPVLGVGVPGQAGRDRHRRRPERRAAERLEPAQQEDQRHAQNEHVDELDRLDPGGALEEMAQKHLLQGRGMDRHAGRRQIERGGAQVLQARGGGADHDRMAGDRFTGDLPGQHPPGRDRAPRLRPGVVQPDAPRFVGRDHQPAHRHLLDGRRSALDPGLLDPHLVAFRPEQDPEHLQGEARIDVVPKAQQQGHPAQDPVHRREEVEAASPARAGVDARQVRRRAGEGGQHRPRVGAGDRDRVAARRPSGVRSAGQGEAGHHRRAPHRLGQHRIVLGQAPEGVPDAFRRLPPQRDRVLRRGAVGLREDEVQADDRRAGLIQLVQQVRDAGARPGPLPDAAQARVVDVDHDDRGRRRRARGEPLVGVEDLEAEGLHEARGADVQPERDRQRGEGNDEVEPGPEAAHGGML